MKKLAIISVAIGLMAVITGCAHHYHYGAGNNYGGPTFRPPHYGYSGYQRPHYGYPPGQHRWQGHRHHHGYRPYY